MSVFVFLKCCSVLVGVLVAAYSRGLGEYL
jgi:hypothetical protein